MLVYPKLRRILAKRLTLLTVWLLLAGVCSAADGVAHEQLRINWSANGDWLWYRNDSTQSDDFLVYTKVDARAGKKFPLFEPDRLASALTTQGVRGVFGPQEMSKVEVLSIGDRGQGFTFRLEGMDYEVDADYHLTPLQTEFDFQKLLTRRTRSGSSSSEMTLQFDNRTAEPVVCWWLSTDGSEHEYATLAASEVHSQHTFAGHVWSFRSLDGTELARIAASESQPSVTIDAELAEAFKNLPARMDSRGQGNRRQSRVEREENGLAVIRDFNVWIKDESGQMQPLTRDGTAERRYRGPVLVSPSRKYLAVIQVKAVPKRKVSIVESSPGLGRQPVVHTFEYEKPGDERDMPQIKLFDLQAGSPIAMGSAQLDASDPFASPHELMANPWSLSLLEWSNDPERILCLYNERGHQRVRVLSIDPLNGEVQAIVDEYSPTFIDYAHKTFSELIDANEHLIWMSERTGYNHLFKYRTTDGQLLTELTSPHLGERGLVREVEQVDTSAQCVWFTASGLVPGEDPYYRHLCRVNLDGSGFVRLTDGKGDHRWEYSPDRRFIIDRYSRVDMPPVTTLRSAEDGRLICELEQADFSELVAGGWTIPEPFMAKGRDGETDIYGVIVRPRDFDPGRKYPVIEKVYAGPQSSYTPKSFSRMRQEHTLADMGCIVVMVDGMGTSHRGKAFHDICWKNLADAGFPDRIAWIKSAAEKYPYFDLSRVGTFGGSAGGQNAMRALIDHHDFYKVAVADCGCHDNRMDKIWWNEAWMGWPVDDSYAQSSNVEHASRMEGKLLLIVGELDRNVDPASTMQVVDALVRANKDFELLIIPGAGHGAAETPYGSRRRTEFLRRHLIEEGAGVK
jgi:dipeptidyl-peptidase 4